MHTVIIRAGNNVSTRTLVGVSFIYTVTIGGFDIGTGVSRIEKTASSSVEG